MKEAKAITVTRYISGDFYVDIVQDKSKGMREAWLQHKDYGISVLMWSENVKERMYTFFYQAVEANLPEHIKNYEEEYMDK